MIRVVTWYDGQEESWKFRVEGNNVVLHEDKGFFEAYAGKKYSFLGKLYFLKEEETYYNHTEYDFEEFDKEVTNLIPGRK